MKTSKDHKPINSFGLLLLGQPKSGKTNLAALLPAPYFADCDNNLASAIRRFPDREMFYDTINVDDSGKEVPPHARWSRMLECVNKADADPRVKSIVVDSLSMVSDYLMAHIMFQQKRTQMEQRDWGTYKVLMSTFITQLRSSGKPIVVIAHEKYDKDEISGVLLHRPLIAGQLADNIGALFTDVWRCECNQVGNDYQYVVRTMLTPRMALGNSLGLPPVCKPEEAVARLLEQGK